MASTGGGGGVALRAPVDASGGVGSGVGGVGVGSINALYGYNDAVRGDEDDDDLKTANGDEDAPDDGGGDDDDDDDGASADDTEALLSEGGRAPPTCWARTKRVLRTYMGVLGPGSMVAVGYMDPGNWATDINAGANFAYDLLMVVLFSSSVAVFMQTLALRLGIASGHDLAQQCARRFSKPVVWVLFVLAQIAIIATDMAEVIGSAIALKLLFGLPLEWGVLASAASVFFVLLGTSKHMNLLEYGILALVLTIFGCFIYLVAASDVNYAELFLGYLPKGVLATNVEALYVAIGIIGATVMPHNLYLHSGMVREHVAGKKKAKAIRYSTYDVGVSLFFAFVVNSAILTVAAANFFNYLPEGHAPSIEDAYDLLLDKLGYAVATVFAVSLLLAGQSSTITGTLAGQFVAEGFINWRLAPWLRGLITRLMAIAPAFAVAFFVEGDAAVDQLLVLSQVILSFQLPFAIFPLVYFTTDTELMGRFANGRVAAVVGYAIATLLAGLNVYLLVEVILGAINGE